jgi:hypothetical protein
MPVHTTHSRDAALRSLRRVNRWMLAGSLVLTGVLSDVAAHAFPGKTVKATSAAEKQAPRARSGSHRPTASHAIKSGLKAPAQAPKATVEAPHEAPSQDAPAKESPPAREIAPAHEAPPETEAPAPVVSGGS